MQEKEEAMESLNKKVSELENQLKEANDIQESKEKEQEEEV